MSVSIKRDRATGKNLGYGFVKMSSHQEARAAKEAMQVNILIVEWHPYRHMLSFSIIKLCSYGTRAMMHACTVDQLLIQV